jgi:hypothetical protein
MAAWCIGVKLSKDLKFMSIGTLLAYSFNILSNYPMSPYSAASIKE